MKNLKKQRDSVFAKKQSRVDFAFNRDVARVFDDMLERSVPFYGEMQRMIVEMVERFYVPETTIYDLGCSTGSTMFTIAQKLKNKNPVLVGVDASLPMLEQARKRFGKNGYKRMVRFEQVDLNQPIVLKNPSVALLTLTLQFVRPLQREYLVKHIYESLVEGGCVILFEKVLGNDSLTNRMFIDFYYDYKKRNGYSTLEIAQKREALENILIPYRLDENMMLLRRNGFPIVDVFFKWHNFVGMIGIK